MLKEETNFRISLVKVIYFRLNKFFLIHLFISISKSVLVTDGNLWFFLDLFLNIFCFFLFLSSLRNLDREFA